MPEFARSFPVGALGTWDSDRPGNAVRSLFERWAMPGRAGTHEAPLRIGVRDGYVNFYVAGQSVAKLSCGRAGPNLSVHSAYVNERAKGAGDRGEAPSRQPYVSYKADTLALPETAALISRWIATAKSYASAEKRFVDRLVEANAGVIDIEMGLPADDTAEGEQRTAPRMDLVVAQARDGEPVSIAFWEAKCSINPELRASDPYREADDGKYEVGPKAIHQLRKYQQWMRAGNRLGEVQAAYRAAANIMLGFWCIFGRKDVPAPECIGIWQSLVAPPAPEVVLPPGLVIGNYCPAGHAAGKPGEALLFGRRGESFGPHRNELASHGVTVFEVASDQADHSLPLLSMGEVRA